MAAAGKSDAAAQLPSTLTWSLVMAVSSLGSLGLAYAQSQTAAAGAVKGGGAPRASLITAGLGIAGYGGAAALASADRRRDAANVGLAASAITAAALLPAWRATRSSAVLNASVMSLASVGFFMFKRSRPQDL
jgi:hypothetical protein